MKCIDRKPAQRKKSLISISSKEAGSCTVGATTEPVLFFQRIVGNQAIQRLLQSNERYTAAKQHNLIQTRRARSGQRRSPIPGFSSKGLHTFLNDLNSIISKTFGRQASLNVNDFSFLSPVQFLSHVKTNATTDYWQASAQASAVCTAHSSRQFQKLCSSNRACRNRILQVQRNRRLCNRGRPTDALIAAFLSTLGLTLPGGGRSLINLGQPGTPRNEILETIVHEGLHRLRGRIWAKRSRIGLGAHHSIAKVRLPHIKKKLDEGTVQILTQIVIKKMQGVQGRNWFRGYTTSKYAQEVAYVQGILSSHNKNRAFLIKAYFSDTSIREVEDLQWWQ